MDLPLNDLEQNLLDTLLEIPPKYEIARSKIEETNISAESITKVGIKYAAECFLDFGDSLFAKTEGSIQLSKAEIPQGISAGLNSTYIYDVIKLLLEYGLDPNLIFESGCSQYNIMKELQFVDNEYIAADTMELLLEHGANPNLIVNGESIFEQVDFEIWFGSIEQYIRWRYDAWVHMWMVLVANGGEIAGKGPMVKTFKEYDSDEMFDLRKLRNHRDFYFGLSIENKERALHVYDKKTLWKVAEW